MNETILQLEQEMWQAVLHRDAARFAQLVAPDAVMICGGYRCLGAEYAGFLADFNISAYTIRHPEVIHSAAAEVTLHYVLETQTETEGPQDLAGTFHVVSMWIEQEGSWKLHFNMDSRIVPPSPAGGSDS